MKTFLASILLAITCHADGLYLVLTPAQFNVANGWLNAQNGWPDGKGTERYCLPFEFKQFSNCPAVLQDRVGLVLDKALIRHCRRDGETRQDAIERIFTVVKNNLSNPTVVRVVSSGGIDEAPTATFSDVTAVVATHLRQLVER